MAIDASGLTKYTNKTGAVQVTSPKTVVPVVTTSVPTTTATAPPKTTIIGGSYAVGGSSPPKPQDTAPIPIPESPTPSPPEAIDIGGLTKYTNKTGAYQSPTTPTTPNIPETEAKATWGFLPNQSNFGPEQQKYDEMSQTVKTAFKENIEFKKAFPSFEKSYLEYKTRYEQNLESVRSSSPTDTWWLDVNKNNIQEENEFFTRDVAIEKMEMEQSPNRIRLDIGGGKTKTYTEIYNDAQSAYKKTDIINRSLAVELTQIQNTKNTLEAYKQAGYKLVTTDKGYSFEEMKPSEVNVKLYGDVGAKARVAALVTAEGGLSLGIIPAIRGIEAAITNDMDKQYEELSARSVGLTMKPNEGGTKVLDYATRFWLKEPEGQSVILAGITMGIGYGVSGLTAKSLSTNASKAATTLYNVGQKSVKVLGGMKIATATGLTAKNVGYPLLVFGIAGTGISLGATAARSPGDLNRAIRENIKGWTGPIIGWGAGSSAFAKNIAKPQYTPEGKLKSDVMGIMDAKVENIGKDIYKVTAEGKIKSINVGAKGGQISDVRINAIGRQIGDRISVSQGTAFIDTDLSTAFTNRIRTDIVDLHGASIKVRGNEVTDLFIEHSVGTPRGQRFNMSTETGLTRVYKNVFKGEIPWEFEKITKGKIKDVDVLLKSKETKLVNVDISTYEHLGRYESLTTKGEYIEKGQVSFIEPKEIEIDFIKGKKAEPILETHQEAILRKLKIDVFDKHSFGALGIARGHVQAKGLLPNIGLRTDVVQGTSLFLGKIVRGEIAHQLHPLRGLNRRMSENLIHGGWYPSNTMENVFYKMGVKEGRLPYRIADVVRKFPGIADVSNKTVETYLKSGEFNEKLTNAMNRYKQGQGLTKTKLIERLSGKQSHSKLQTMLESQRLKYRSLTLTGGKTIGGLVSDIHSQIKTKTGYIFSGGNILVSPELEVKESETFFSIPKTIVGEINLSQLKHEPFNLLRQTPIQIPVSKQDSGQWLRGVQTQPLLQEQLQEQKLQQIQKQDLVQLQDLKQGVMQTKMQTPKMQSAIKSSTVFPVLPIIPIKAYGRGQRGAEFNLFGEKYRFRGVLKFDPIKQLNKMKVKLKVKS